MPPLNPNDAANSPSSESPGPLHPAAPNGPPLEPSQGSDLSPRNSSSRSTPTVPVLCLSTRESSAPDTGPSQQAKNCPLCTVRADSCACSSSASPQNPSVETLPRIALVQRYRAPKRSA